MMKQRIQTDKTLGFTLIELVVTIVVLTVAAIGIISASSEIGKRSADPMLRNQALAIAKSYIEEIQLKAYAPLASCPAVPGSGGRANFSHVCHYSPWTDNVVKDQFENALAEFSQYSVDITVSQTGNLGPGGSQVPSADALLVTVTVDHSANPTSGSLAMLSAYRTNY